ncbi:uncharacterized protein At4g02000-like [Arachis stenosperma]|uniref:uncharacterized protein At4g02000-like n=1 Tax=Arachis stenosperma TaxID=217475 RepID=UPI0025AC5C79|nr:uncharacterized protein At4g02000-like [Arachis stenosperma]
MIELAPQIYQFFFQNETDLTRVLQSSPWLFHNEWLLLSRWIRNFNVNTPAFNSVELKLQLWNLLEHCKTTTLGTKIAERLGKVKECKMFTAKPGRSSFLKATIRMDILKPIKSGVFMGNKINGRTWIKFCYERLPTFCYYCGLIGHNENNCAQADLKDPNQPDKKEFGPWIRANTIGSIVEHRETEEDFQGDGRFDQKIGRADVLEGFAKLFVKDTRDSALSGQVDTIRG